MRAGLGRRKDQVNHSSDDQQTTNNKLFFIANGIIKEFIAKIEGISLTLFSIGFAFYLDIKLGIIFIIIFVITGIVYSFSPFNWKDKAIPGIIANFIGGWSVAACGWIAAGTENWGFIIYTIPYGIGLVAVYLLTTLPDIPGDRESNKITFGVKYGEKASTYWALGFEVVTVVYSYLTKDYMLFLPALCSLPLFLIAAISQNMDDSLKAIKYTVLFASLAVCIKYPLYFLLLVFTFYFSKWYYQKRFNLEYPKFAA